MLNAINAHKIDDYQKSLSLYFQRGNLWDSPAPAGLSFPGKAVLAVCIISFDPK